MSKIKPFLLWALPIIATWATIWAVFSAFQSYESHIDADILLFIGGSFLIAALFLVGYTRHWTWRGLGQTFAYLSDAGLYLGWGASAKGWRGSLDRKDYDLLRAGFIVSASLLIIGLATMVARRHGTRIKHEVYRPFRWAHRKFKGSKVNANEVNR